MSRIVLAVIVSFFFSVISSSAEMYRWEDANGVVTFKDTPPPASKKRGRVKIYSESDFEAPPPRSPAASRADRPAVAPAVLPAPAKKERFSGTVEIYVTDWCGYCKQARSYLDSKGIPYVAYDIEKDRTAKQRHKDLGGRGVPLIIIGSNRMSGFSRETLDFYLNNP